jgi:hypothetical protein
VPLPALALALAAALSPAAAQCELTQLVEPAGAANPFAFFGSSLDLRDGTVVVGNGAWFATEESPSWVFDPSPAGGWEPAVSLPATGKMTLYGSSVAVDGDTAVVGGQADDDADAQSYVFERVAGTWVPTAVLSAPGSNWQYGDGLHVDIEGDTIIVGSTFDSAVRVFERGDGSWPLVHELVPAGPLPVLGFAQSVSLRGERVVVGGRLDAGPTLSPGLACVYERQGGAFVPTVQLVPAEGQPGDGAGVAVAQDGDTIVLGAPGHDLGFIDLNFGAAFVFERQSGAWTQTTFLKAPGFNVDDAFGSALALQGDTLVVGAARRDVGGVDQAGAAFVFLRDGTAWEPIATLAADEPVQYARYGSSLALEGDTLLVGAPYASQGNQDAVVVVRGVSGLPFWSKVWGAVAGSAGTPCGSGLGAPAVGGEGGVVLAGTSPGSAGWLVLGLDRINAPFKGGVMVPAPELLLPFVTDALGAHEISWTWPAGLPSGIKLWMQHWIADAGAPAGFAGGNGLLVDLP